MQLSYGNIGDAFAYEALAVSSTAKACTAATYTPSGARGAVAALISVEDASIRVRLDGTAPTATEGHEVLAGESIVVTAPNIASLKMIRTGSTDADVKVTYFR